MFTLFEDIKLTEGYLRSVLLDISRSKFHFIPNILAKMIQKYNRHCDMSLLENYKKKYPELYAEYFQLLVQEDMIFDVDKTQIQYFEKISDTFEYPFPIESITILLNEQNVKDVRLFLEKGLHSITRNIGIVITDNISIDILSSLIKLIFYNDTLVGLRIILNEKWKQWEQQLIDEKKGLIVLQFIPVSITNNYFDSSFYKDKWVKLSPNLLLYTEIKNHHPYFNKKLFIGAMSELKNAPESKDIHGYLKDINDNKTLMQIISTQSFQRYWNIKKMEICICKDCELKDMCIDNRPPFIQHRNNEWSC